MSSIATKRQTQTAVLLVVKIGLLRTERVFKEDEHDISLETFDSGMVKVTVRSGETVEMVKFYAPGGFKSIALHRVASKAVV